MCLQGSCQRGWNSPHIWHSFSNTTACRIHSPPTLSALAAGITEARQIISAHWGTSSVEHSEAQRGTVAHPGTASHGSTPGHSMALHHADTGAALLSVGHRSRCNERFNPRHTSQHSPSVKPEEHEYLKHYGHNPRNTDQHVARLYETCEAASPHCSWRLSASRGFSTRD